LKSKLATITQAADNDVVLEDFLGSKLASGRSCETHHIQRPEPTRTRTQTENRATKSFQTKSTKTLAVLRRVKFWPNQ